MTRTIGAAVDAGGGPLAKASLPFTISGSFGQIVRLTFTNVNAVGTMVAVSSSVGQRAGGIILPFQSVTYTFGNWGNEPMSWSFTVTSASSAFVLTYGIESTWVEGMPTNPCE